jgi:RNA polymerase sigma factor (TIGR02999 family)
MLEPETTDVTRLLVSWSSGDKVALEQLMPLVYAELRRLASQHLRRERPDHTLNTTDLVHEAYLQLVNQNQVESNTRAQFFGIAANLMRQILVKHALRRRTAKRGRGNRVTLEDTLALVEQPRIDLLALDRALDKLAVFDPRQCRIVELRFFGGLTEDEIAVLLGISDRTVRREWRIARALLRSDLLHGDLQ